MADDCLFCKIVAGEIPSDVIYSDDELYAFRDVTPQSPTHILLIPRKHIATIADVTSDDAALLSAMFLRANEIARQEGLDEKGFRYVLNCGVHGGQSVYHIHLHIMGGRQMTWPPG